MLNSTGLEIAIIGLSIRVPGAKNQFEFWENLKKGKECISHFSVDELVRLGIEKEIVTSSNYIKSKGVLDGIESFDAAFFNYSPKIASLMDPQFRQLHECAIEAFDDAGYNPDSNNGLVGMYAGAATNFNWITRNLASVNNPTQIFEADNVNNRDYLGSNISYKLNLNGPSFTVQTACSTSLVAVHLACQGLLSGDCDMAIAGGVSITYPKNSGYEYIEGMVHSSDGHCRPFDSSADGTVPGDGIGVVMLKRLEDAIKDEDNIYAVIKGSAINNDGNRKVDFTAPSVKGQYEVIQSALEMAEVNPETLSYVEAHGTGTKLGDPIEIEALKKAFNTGKRNYCAIGSVKSNIGHLINAAGIIGMIKTALSIKHKFIPASLHYKKSNPLINFENSPFYVANKPIIWKNEILRAGVSSFGIGGTNAHVIMEEAPKKNHAFVSHHHPGIFTFSAKTESSLFDYKEKFCDFIKKYNDHDLNNTSYTLNCCRKSFEKKSFIIANSNTELISKLEEKSSAFQKPIKEKALNIVFMFSGQGSQYFGMAKGLYETEPYFKNQFDKCNRIANEKSNINYLNILLENQSNINNTEITQPLLFIIEYSLAQLLIHWGVKPKALIGHSIGEYIAACLANVFTLETAIAIVIKRGQLMEKTKSGNMISVFCEYEKIKGIIDENISVAAINGNDQLVLSGSEMHIEEIISKLSEKNIHIVKLKSSKAFHSYLMDDVLLEFEEFLSEYFFSKPEIPLISNLSGNWANDEIMNPKYWVQHLRSSVLYYDGIKTLINDDYNIFIEVGPGDILKKITSQICADKDVITLNTLPNQKNNIEDHYQLLETIGILWTNGIKINWRIVHENNKGYKISLPTYAFDKQNYWDNSIMSKVNFINLFNEKTFDKQKNKLSSWYYYPSWIEKFKNNFIENSVLNEKWIVFGSGSRVEKEILNNLKILPNNSYFLTKEDLSDDISQFDSIFGRFISTIDNQPQLELNLLHFWTLNVNSYEENYRCGYFSIICFIRQLKRNRPDIKINITIITNNIFEVYDLDKIVPEKSLLIGPQRAINKEFPDVKIGIVDIGKTELNPNPILAENVIKEIKYPEFDQDFVMLRGQKRFVYDYKVLDPSAAQTSEKIKKNGNYIITGGIGGLGLQTALAMSQINTCRLILIGRKKLPPETLWKEISSNKEYELYSIVKSLQIIKEKGCEVELVSCDICDFNALSLQVDLLESKYGKISGVIHAAGISDGNLIETQTSEKSRKVFNPKLNGALNLIRLFDRYPLDFLIFYSSNLAYLGGFGQAAYVAANSFLNSLAEKYSMSNHKTVMSISWDGWKETGMAIANEKSKFSSFENIEIINDHPMFNEYLIIHKDHLVYTSILNIKDFWIFNEHKDGDKGVLPGTAYLEMIFYISKKFFNHKNVHIKELYFSTPLLIEPDKSVKLYTSVEVIDGELDIKFKSFENEKSITHAFAKVKSHKLSPSKINIIKNDELDAVENFNDGEVFKESLITYGERWENINKVKINPDGEGIALLSLSEKYENDVIDYKMHPAILDTATSFLLMSNETKKSFLPFSYQNIYFFDDISNEVYSYSKVLKKNISSQVVVETIIYNSLGVELLKIGEFSLTEFSKNKISEKYDPVFDTKGKELDEFGISNKEGQTIIKSLFFGHFPPNVIISTIDFNKRRNEKFNIEDRSLNLTDNISSHRKKYPRPDLKTPYKPTENPVQKQLADIWGDILGIENIGIDDNFFELGGDSLKAITIVNKLQSANIIKIQVSDVFANPTILGLSKKVPQENAYEYTNISEAPKEKYYPATHSQKRLFVLGQFNNIGKAYNMPVKFHISGELDITRLKNAIKNVIERHKILRTSFEFIDNDVKQVIHSKVKLPFQEIKIESRIEQIDNVILNNLTKFDLKTAPLINVLLFNLEQNEYILLIDIHHIIADGTSVGILVDEIIKSYQGQDLEQPKLQYKDFAVWQQKFTNSKEYEKQKKYWLDLLSKPRLNFNLSTDYPRKEKKVYSGNVYNFLLDKEITNQIKNVSTNQNASIFMFMLSAFKILLYNITGYKHIIVGNNGGGRNHPDVNDMVGMFANTYPIYTIIQENHSFQELLSNVRINCLKAIENQDYPFEEIVRELNLDKQLSKDPLFNIVFNAQNFHKQIVEKKIFLKDQNLIVENKYFQNKTSKFDMIVFMHEEDSEIRLEIEYNDTLFKHTTIENLVNDYLQLIKKVIQNIELDIENLIASDKKMNQKGKPEIKFNF